MIIHSFAIYNYTVRYYKILHTGPLPCAAHEQLLLWSFICSLGSPLAFAKQLLFFLVMYKVLKTFIKVQGSR